jgi:hypothetical protein
MQNGGIYPTVIENTIQFGRQYHLLGLVLAGFMKERMTLRLLLENLMGV